jgi:hypothetical protein
MNRNRRPTLFFSPIPFISTRFIYNQFFQSHTNIMIQFLCRFLTIQSILNDEKLNNLVSFTCLCASLKQNFVLLPTTKGKTHLIVQVYACGFVMLYLLHFLCNNERRKKSGRQRK